MMAFRACDGGWTWELPQIASGPEFALALDLPGRAVVGTGAGAEPLGIGGAGCTMLPLHGQKYSETK
jgi:hypothetical protein